MYSDMGKDVGRFGSFGEGTMRSRSSDFGGRSGGYASKSSKFGREGASSSVRTGGYGGIGSGRSRGGFSGPSSGRSGKFGGGSGDTRGSKRLGGFRNFGSFGSSKSSNRRTNFAEEFGSGRSRRFGDSDYDRNNRSSRFDGFGDDKDSGEW